MRTVPIDPAGKPGLEQMWDHATAAWNALAPIAGEKPVTGRLFEDQARSTDWTARVPYPLARDKVGGATNRLSDQSVALIVLNPPRLPQFLSGPTRYRAGYATAAATAGVEEGKIANVTPAPRTLPVLRGYIRASTGGVPTSR